MTKRCFCFTFFLLICFSLPLIATAQTVNIPDDNLRAAIERTLGKASGTTITRADMATLTSLFAGNANIRNLTGLEHATNLTILHLGATYVFTEERFLNSNSISDISPLTGLTKLVDLGLGSNSISNISPLAGLNNLKVLGLEKNSIANISPLAGLNNLTKLYLSDNSISNLSPLANLTNLADLELWGNSISSISSLAGLNNLEWLWLEHNNISDLSPLAGLASLTELDLDSNSISDISPLAGLTNLTDLRLERNNISDLSPLQRLNKLTVLWLGSNSISDISFIAGLTNLSGLFLWSNSISDISPLARLTNLRRLALDDNSIADILPLVENIGLGTGDRVWLRKNPLNSASINTHIPALKRRGVTVVFDAVVTEAVDIPDPNLRAAIERELGVASGATITTADMETLTRLEAPVADITDLTGLEHAINLTRLDLWLNSVSDISALVGLTKLTELRLPNNPISDISALAGLTNLTRLNLGGIYLITDISALAGLANLTWLSLGGNFISDISALSGLTNLTTLFLDQNSISDLSPLVANTGLGRGDTVDVSDNPLNDTSINTHIPALQSRGVNISFSNLKPVTSEYTLSIPAGISLIHVPLRVTEVDGREQTIERISDLYDALGGASTVNFLITYDTISQEWRSFFVPSDKEGPADSELSDDIGIIVGLRAPVSVRLRGTALGTNASSTITLNQGLNLVGLPLNDSRINRVSDLFKLDGIGGNVPVIILTDGGEFKAVGRAGDPGDIEITGGQAFIMTASQDATVAISGDAWANGSGTAAAPPVTRQGIEAGNTTPVLGLRGAVVDEGTGLKADGFRVTVKNLSTGKAVAAVTTPDEAGYRSTVVDIETGRAAAVGDILEISARSPNPFVGVEPLQYAVTAEDMKRSLIQLPELIAYEIPAETELLANYPNPFNPETWIPYRLAEDAFVTLTIYDLNGQVVRTLDVGHQVAAVYESQSKAIYWDGRNEIGEQVASGVYFYHLSAGRSGLSVPHRSEYSATRKMVILK